MTGKLCTGRRAEADGWLSHEEESGEPGVGLPIAACAVRGTRPMVLSALTGRASPAAAAAQGGNSRPDQLRAPVERARGAEEAVGLRQEFIATGEPIEADLKSLKRAVPCPAGRAVPAACRPEIAYTGGGPVRWAGEADMGGARCPATVGHAGVLVMSDLVGRLLGRRGWERPPASSSSGQ